MYFCNAKDYSYHYKNCQNKINGQNNSIIFYPFGCRSGLRNLAAKIVQNTSKRLGTHEALTTDYV